MPCVYPFTSSSKEEINKVSKLYEEAVIMKQGELLHIHAHSNKKFKGDKSILEFVNAATINDDTIWVFLEVTHCRMISVTLGDKLILQQDRMLNDRHINFAQWLLILQFPSIEGFTSHYQLKGDRKISHGMVI